MYPFFIPLFFALLFYYKECITKMQQKLAEKKENYKKVLTYG
nr:MAG TPA: holin family protein [Caudoviricetes sp.]